MTQTDKSIADPPPLGKVVGQYFPASYAEHHYGLKLLVVLIMLLGAFDLWMLCQND